MNQTQFMWIYKSDSLYNLGLESHLISFGERGKEIENIDKIEEKGT